MWWMPQRGRTTIARITAKVRATARVKVRAKVRAKAKVRIIVKTTVRIIARIIVRIIVRTIITARAAIRITIARIAATQMEIRIVTLIRKVWIRRLRPEQSISDSCWGRQLLYFS